MNKFANKKNDHENIIKTKDIVIFKNIYTICIYNGYNSL